MDEKIAYYLISSLIDRVEQGPVGSVSEMEKEALKVALRVLTAHSSTSAEVAKVASADVAKVVKQAEEAIAEELKDEPEVLEPEAIESPAGGKPAIEPPELEKSETVELVLDALHVSAPSDPGYLLCLDFGTASSKACATNGRRHFGLELGRAVGSEGFTLPSSIFVDDGKVYFGFEAIDRSESMVDAGRQRLDSIKSWLSFADHVNIDTVLLSEALNPGPIKLTQGDFLRIYLAYFTDIATTQLSILPVEGASLGRLMKRRYARPCGRDAQQAAWVDTLMRRLLSEAQILADTFHGQWEGGIDIRRLKSAVEEVRKLEHRPEFLIGDGVPEPVAVAAAAVESSENRIDAYMVVDAGAGTTDFGLFLALRNQAMDEPKVIQVASSIKGSGQAGDKIDQCLQAFIGQREGFDPKSTHGAMIEADLRRRIRVLKELLFATGSLEYTLADRTVGSFTREEFCNDLRVQSFAKLLKKGFVDALSDVNESYLDYLARDPVKLQVILTGGSSRLPMIQDLAHGVIEVKGRKISCVPVEAMPDWMEHATEAMRSVYPQLAVAIGGAEEHLPSTDFAPEEWFRKTHNSVVATRDPISGL
ncbi:hypothetical protein P5W99_00860 [Paraburkholderia sp. A3BS-1L]|uniref:hypothetical protein n=1 Tax=Paraburkholderia sp. A3BS-1L TaxID=3028375 RepID=UPI003DA9614B